MCYSYTIDHVLLVDHLLVKQYHSMSDTPWPRQVAAVAPSRQEGECCSVHCSGQNLSDYTHHGHSDDDDDDDDEEEEEEEVVVVVFVDDAADDDGDDVVVDDELLVDDDEDGDVASFLLFLSFSFISKTDNGHDLGGLGARLHHFRRPGACPPLRARGGVSVFFFGANFLDIHCLDVQDDCSTAKLCFLSLGLLQILVSVKIGSAKPPWHPVEYYGISNWV